MSDREQLQDKEIKMDFTAPPPFYNPTICAKILLPPVIGYSVLALFLRYVV